MIWNEITTAQAQKYVNEIDLFTSRPLCGLSHQPTTPARDVHKVTQLGKGAASQATRTQSHSFFSSSGRSIKLQLSLNFLSIFLLIPLYNSEITKSILKPIICLTKKNVCNYCKKFCTYRTSWFTHNCNQKQTQ